METAVVLVVSAFLAGVLVYLAVSFALVRQHCLARPARAELGAAIEEAFWVVLTQPLLPLFYFVGRRMGGTEGGVPVVLVHGYAQNRVDFVRLAPALARAGSGPIYGFNYLWTSPVAECADRLATFVEEVRLAHGVDHVDLVCHSLGGVVALEYIRVLGQGRVRRCVTVASPHAGVAWRGPVIGASGVELRRDSGFFRGRTPCLQGVACLSIASTHDNVVHPPATSSLASHGGEDMVVGHLGHLTLLFSPPVIDAVARFVGAGYCGAQVDTPAPTMRSGNVVSSDVVPSDGRKRLTSDDAPPLAVNT